MSYLVYLNHYDIRQCKAQYLSVLYEILGKKLDAYFLLNEDYIQKYDKGKRWEVKWLEENWGNYEEVVSSLKPNNYSIMDRAEKLTLNEYFSMEPQCPSQILYNVVNNEYIPEEMEAITEALQKEGNNIKAGITWVNNACLKETLREFCIPTIHHELGPLRPSTYIPTAYLDFSGVNGNTEFDRRFKEFLKIANEVPILSRGKLLRVVSPEHYMELYKILYEDRREYEIGVGLQVEVDTNLLLFNRGCNWVDPILEARAEAKGKVLVRPHPSAGYLMKKDAKLDIDDLKGNAVSFINKCNKIYCLNSSVGFEAMLLGREAKIFGDSPFRSMCRMDEDKKLKALNFAIFGYLIHRNLLFDDSYYKFRLAHRGDEKTIYLDNVKRLLKNIKL